MACRKAYIAKTNDTEKEVAQYVKDYVDDVDKPDGFVFNRWVADMYLEGKPIDWDDFI